MAADYTVIGKKFFIFPGLSMLQNGPVPTYFDESTRSKQAFFKQQLRRI